MRENLGTTAITRSYLQSNVSKSKISLKHNVYIKKTLWNETIFNVYIMQWKNFSFIFNCVHVILDRILILNYQIAHTERKNYHIYHRLRLQFKKFINSLTVVSFKEYFLKFGVYSLQAKLFRQYSRLKFWPKRQTFSEILCN